MCLGDMLRNGSANRLLLIHSNIRQRMERNLMQTSFLYFEWNSLRGKTCMPMQTIGRAKD